MNWIIKSFALIALIALIGCNRSAPTVADKGPGDAAKFIAVKPRKDMLPKFIDQPGTVQAYEDSQLFAKLAGFIKQYHVEIGDIVEGPIFDAKGKIAKPGTVLAELSIPEIEDEARKAEALAVQVEEERNQAIAQEVVGKASFEAAEAVVKQADAGLKQAKANRARWQSEDDRIAKLVKEKVVDPQTADETHNQFLTADAAKEEAEARVTTAQRNAAKSKAEWDKAKSDVKAAAARVNVANAERDRVKTLSDYRFIRAPFSGTITKRKSDLGRFVFPAGSDKAEALFTIMRLDRVRIQVDVPEADAGLVVKGAKVIVKAQAQKAVEFEANVTRTSESLDPASRTLKVEIERQNVDPKLKAGTYVNVRIIAPMPPAWVLPSSAVVKQADVVICFRHENGKAVRMPIRIGRSNAEFTEVMYKQVGDAWVDWTGDEAILSGPAGTLKDGQEVKLGP